MEPLIRDRATLVAVLGAGVIVGVSGLYLYLKHSNRHVSRELSHLTRTIESLRKDIEELKVAKGSTATAVTRRSFSGSGGSLDRVPLEGNSAHSVVSDAEDEEYFDVSEEGQDTGWNNATVAKEKTEEQSWDAVNGDVSPSSELGPLFEKIERLFEGDPLEQQEAYDILMSKKEDYVNNAEFMWRLAKACYQNCITAVCANDPDREKQFIFDGLKYAGIALALDDTSGEIHKWYAVMLGRTTDHLGIPDKIKTGHLFKQHVDIAIKLMPDDHSLYFMKGRWCYEIARLTWLERKVASTLFATPPTSSYAEAREMFMEVERLKPEEWKENMLFIAKCFIGEGTYSAAVSWLDKADQVPCKSQDDENIQKEIKELLAKYSYYRK